MAGRTIDIISVPCVLGYSDGRIRVSDHAPVSHAHIIADKTIDKRCALGQILANSGGRKADGQKKQQAEYTHKRTLSSECGHTRG